MIENKLFEESKKCDNCMQWHKYCHVECCKTIFVDVSLEELKNSRLYIEVRKVLTFDEKLYYRLHKVNYVHGCLRFEKKKCVVDNGRVIYAQPCEYLEGLKCSHYDFIRPKICRELKTGSENNSNYMLTDKCLFRFKKI